MHILDMFFDSDSALLLLQKLDAAAKSVISLMTSRLTTVSQDACAGT